MKTNEIIPFKATHPGILIKDELDVRADLNQKELATRMGVKASFLNEIIKGKRPLTADIAILLEKILEIPATYWMKFQSQYEIDKARQKEKSLRKLKNIELWNLIKKYVPVNYFKKNNYLTDNIENNISIIKSIYSINTIEDLVSIFKEDKFAFYRKSEKLKIDKKNMLAWSSLATYEAQRKKVNNFNPNQINSLCIELNKIFFENNNTIEKTRVLLAQYGIKFITINKLDKTPVDGYSFWSDNNPAIALSLRYNRIDNFAFTLFHEIGHIVLHLVNNKEIKFLDLLNANSNDSYEKEANKFAQDKIIPKEIWSNIMNNHLPLDDNKIIKLSKLYGINPAIFLGRLSYETDNYAFKTKITKQLK